MDSPRGGRVATASPGPSPRRLSRLGPGSPGPTSTGGASGGGDTASPPRVHAEEGSPTSPGARLPNPPDIGGAVEWQPWTEEEAEMALAAAAGRLPNAVSFAQNKPIVVDNEYRRDKDMPPGSRLFPSPVGDAAPGPSSGRPAGGGPLGEGYEGYEIGAGSLTGSPVAAGAAAAAAAAGSFSVTRGREDSYLYTSNLVQRSMQSQGGRKMSQYRRGGVTVSPCCLNSCSQYTGNVPLPEVASHIHPGRILPLVDSSAMSGRTTSRMPWGPTTPWSRVLTWGR